MRKKREKISVITQKPIRPIVTVRFRFDFTIPCVFPESFKRVPSGKEESKQSQKKKRRKRGQTKRNESRGEAEKKKTIRTKTAKK